MKAGHFLKINEPTIVHETIDGETILIDLKSGIYYSLDGIGAIIWELIEKSGNWKKAIKIIVDENKTLSNTIDQSITAFIEKLVEENILVNTDFETTNSEVSEIEIQLKKAAKSYVAPNLIKHTDMEDLLLLDPIHEVGEKGWPESKNIPDEDTTETKDV